MMNFTAFCESHGLLVQHAAPSDRIRRCPTATHPKSKNGAYFFDGLRGWCQNWESGAPAEWWTSDSTRTWTDADKARWLQDQRQARAQRCEVARRAAERARQMLRSATLRTHDYLVRKGFPDARGHVDADGALLIHMRTLTWQTAGLQRITLESGQWVKRMLYGMRAKGSVTEIGARTERPSETCLVEGYSTGMSVWHALRAMGLSHTQVLVCFSADNLTYIAPRLAGKRWVMADNDASGTGQRAAEQTGLPWVMPATVGQDANDLHQSSGLWALQALINRVRRPRK